MWTLRTVAHIQHPCLNNTALSSRQRLDSGHCLELWFPHSLRCSCPASHICCIFTYCSGWCHLDSGVPLCHYCLCHTHSVLPPQVLVLMTAPQAHIYVMMQSLPEPQVTVWLISQSTFTYTLRVISLGSSPLVTGALVYTTAAWPNFTHYAVSPLLVSPKTSMVARIVSDACPHLPQYMWMLSCLCADRSLWLFLSVCVCVCV